MKIIAIDSSSLVASVAIATEESVIAEYSVNYKKTHSQTLLPMLDEIKTMTELDLSSVDAIAVTSGPGSFTGLRIGSSTAKGLALALGKPIVEVPTVDALAMNMWGSADLVCPLMDARRNQVYTGFYEFDENDELSVIKERFAEDIEKVVGMLNDIGKSVTFLGDGVDVSKEAIRRVMRIPFRFAPPHLSRQRAGSVATLAVKYYKEGRMVDSSAHKPEYLRMSQAERERCS
ncbi:MAG: tRNA (adenosine(37)-N6)-threonylcarbamoyltransferase complex dimerization subunit type 1 TsaB [Lachnospiraceae bacterium]|nr:tRNA (adenosine(37)-N6)-threonylcarbamoyltransferase complex dimerization subunit type 1 TsaB [Lachnospiraceae bacterium]